MERFALKQYSSKQWQSVVFLDQRSIDGRLLETFGWCDAKDVFENVFTLRLRSDDTPEVLLINYATGYLEASKALNYISDELLPSYREDEVWHIESGVLTRDIVKMHMTIGCKDVETAKEVSEKALKNCPYIATCDIGKQYGAITVYLESL